MIKGIIRVSVVKPKGSSDFLVQPAICYAEPGDIFRLFNMTNEKLRVEFTKAPFPPDGKKKTVDKGEEVSLDIPLDARKGRHSYQIHMIKSGVLAKGNSDPVIVVDNP
jgi:hypothetical protein